MDKKNKSNKGIIPNISEHYKAMPIFYEFEKMPMEKLSDKIFRQYIYCGQSMLVKWTFKKGAVVPLHHHTNEQITWITKGSVRIYSQGQEFIVKAGEVITFPPNVPHEFEALEDTIDIDFFTPVREDWIHEMTAYLNLSKK
jgi:quercetin dioxygenase-like cupin family protein